MRPGSVTAYRDKHQRERQPTAPCFISCTLGLVKLVIMGTQKLYPRGTVKRIVKAHANRNVSKNADILVSYYYFDNLFDKTWVY